jgi:hypothetical protein
MLIPKIRKIKAKRILFILHIGKIKPKGILLIKELKKTKARQNPLIPEIRKIEANKKLIYSITSPYCRTSGGAAGAHVNRHI